MKFKGKLAVFIISTLIGLALNLFKLPLFLNSINVLFGEALALFVLEVLGLRFALATSVILGIQRFILHNDVVMPPVLILSVLSIYLLRRLSYMNLIFAGWLFWASVGWIAVFLIYTELLNINSSLAITLSFKEAVNGLINVTMASLLALLYGYYFERDRKVSYVELIFVSLIVVSIVPMFLKSVHQAKEGEKDFVRSVRVDMEIISDNLEESILYWLNIHLNAVKELANRLVVWGPENREQLQRDTEAIRRAFSEFHACYIADSEATAITFYPEINPKGKYMIGTNFNYRPYYKEVKRTHKHTFTQVFIAKFALKPVVGIAVPAVKEGKFLGYAYCGLRLDRLRSVVREFSLKEGVFVTLIDKKNRIIVSNKEGVKPLQEFERGELKITSFGLVMETFRGEHDSKFNPPADRLYHSFFYRENKLREDVGWTVVMEVSIVPYLKELMSKLNTNFLSIYALALLSFLLARFLTSISTKPVQKLADAIGVITRNLEKNPPLNLPGTNIAEIKELTESFRDMANKAMSYLEELKKMAYFDPLTGLPNRTLLRDRIESAIHFANRNGSKVAILFIDLDYFKTVNDTLGHDVGDRILVQVAKRLSSVFRETDTVARFGGDEFVAVIPDVRDLKDVVQVAERILSLFSTPFEANGEDIYLSASVGIAVYPDNGENPTELIKNADMAMYRAKEEGKSNFSFFTEEMNSKAVEILSVKNKLHKALERGEFLLYYQPIYSLGDNSIVGLEALLRWRDPDRGLVSPAKFMPILEELGLVKEVGRWVMGEAFKKSREWGDRYGIYVSMNISPRQFMDRNFVKRVLQIASDTNANNEHVVLEITETSLMRNPEESVSILKRLRAKGFKVAVDDFGTGYSSLAYLKRLPIDIIKVDMTFTQGMVKSNVDRSIVMAVIGLSKSLGLKSLAEGVETREQVNILRELGCDLAQGYLFGKPMKEEEAEALIRKEKGL